MNRWIGFGAVVLGIAVIFVWIPLDVESGLVEKARRAVTLGDAFAPTVSGLLICLGGLLCIVSNETQPSVVIDSRVNATAVDLGVNDHALHALAMLLFFIVGLTLMRYAGPVAAFYFHENQTEYRLLRDTIPWKYIGFILGGTTLIAGLIAWTERKLKVIHVAIGFAATVVLIVLYDLPFNDLLLPPNGDV